MVSSSSPARTATPARSTPTKSPLGAIPATSTATLERTRPHTANTSPSTVLRSSSSLSTGTMARAATRLAPLPAPLLPLALVRPLEATETRLSRQPSLLVLPLLLVHLLAQQLLSLAPLLDWRWPARASTLLCRSPSWACSRCCKVRLNTDLTQKIRKTGLISWKLPA